MLFLITQISKVFRSLPFSNELLNLSVANIAPDFDDLFDQTNVILDPDLLQVTFDQVETPFSKCEGDQTRLSSILVSRIVFKCFSRNVNTTVSLRTQASFEAAHDEACSVCRNEDHVSIIAVVRNLQFHPDFQGNNLVMIFTSQANMLSVPTLTSLLAMKNPSPSMSTGFAAKRRALVYPLPSLNQLKRLPTSFAIISFLPMSRNATTTIKIQTPLFLSKTWSPSSRTRLVPKSLASTSIRPTLLIKWLLFAMVLFFLQSMTRRNFRRPSRIVMLLLSMDFDLGIDLSPNTAMPVEFISRTL